MNTRIGSEMQSMTTANKEVDAEFGLPIFDQNKDPVEYAEVEKVKHMVVQERGHGQWRKQGINLVALCILLVNQILRGKTFAKCSAPDWVAVTVFFCCMVAIVYISCKNVAAE